MRRLLLALTYFFIVASPLPVSAQPQMLQKSESITDPQTGPATRRGPKKPAARPAKGKTATDAEKPKTPPREPFTAADENAAVIAGIPDARFWGDSEQQFIAALPQMNGPWLAVSSGGSDGAFGAGLIVGLGTAGKRPEFGLVSGVSTGALIAPFIFAGAKYDEALSKAYTTINAGDVFEVGATPESFFDTWPLKELIAKRVTPELLADIAVEHRRGRRLFVATTNLDSERPVIWNMGAIAAAGGDKALKLFREVLLASASIPGAFPPVLIDVEANGKHFQEMHGDGGLCGQFFVAPEPILTPTSHYRLPTSDLYVIVNSQLTPAFGVTERNLTAIVARSISVIVRSLTVDMIERSYLLAKRSGTSFNLATIPLNFNQPSRGAFDTEYMKALFTLGVEAGTKGDAFVHEPPSLRTRPNP
jgi:hypothetical protein